MNWKGGRGRGRLKGNKGEEMRGISGKEWFTEEGSQTED